MPYIFTITFYTLIYDFSQIRIFKMVNTYFIVNQNREGKNIVAPIIKIRDDIFIIYNHFQGEDIKIIWGEP